MLVRYAITTSQSNKLKSPFGEYHFPEDEIIYLFVYQCICLFFDKKNQNAENKNYEEDNRVFSLSDGFSAS